MPPHEERPRWPAQRFEQYRTFSQSRSHFLRQVKGLPQLAQTFVGRSRFCNRFVIITSYPVCLTHVNRSSR